MSCAAYALGLQGEVNLRHHKLTLTQWPTVESGRNIPPLRLGFASDFHAGPLTSHQLLVEALDMLEMQKPDVVLLGGDYVTGHAYNINPLCSLLERFCPPLGIYAVLGNHDLCTDDVHIVTQLEKTGVHVLMNANIRLPPPYDGISICGIEETEYGNPSVSQTLKDASQTRILLMHSPNGVHLFNDEQIDLVLCGHTHGGQIVLPNGFAPYIPQPEGCRKYAHGCFDLPRQKGHLLVSRGIGCSLLPVRFLAQPEVHLCEIHSNGALNN
ncbi:MAG: metallophosphoesterase [Gallionella sp.]|nr:metallophosphoesterase [Gallionella sp.]